MEDWLKYQISSLITYGQTQKQTDRHVYVMKPWHGSEAIHTHILWIEVYKWDYCIVVQMVVTQYTGNLIHCSMYSNDFNVNGDN